MLLASALDDALGFSCQPPTEMTSLWWELIVTPNNHDSFSRSVFSTPVHAASLLATFMGKSFSNDYDLATLTLLLSTFVVPDLRRHEADFLFKVQVSSFTFTS